MPKASPRKATGLYGARTEKSTSVAVKSVVLRSSGQNLTAVGTYSEMTSRPFDPTLLALGFLAVRSHISRGGRGPRDVPGGRPPGPDPYLIDGQRVPRPPISPFRTAHLAAKGIDLPQVGQDTAAEPRPVLGSPLTSL
ncbi:hypothetical protein [Streptomyces gibsoniae]|uniref:Uncharacterized protein n=1 Tax=Streptomyces gibsoniae TaxID=3075529 RepID=A0ABU2TU39_9ACTN|nr:hypothetical protein [Streptomyces sp. DSM 41699]MDT0464473.1 hypothetical protein [Streptomyces sp. DSM 41699]